MSKLNPPERRDPPRYVDLNEDETGQLQLIKLGYPRKLVIEAGNQRSVKAMMVGLSVTLDRSTVLLRSFRNV